MTTDQAQVVCHPVPKRLLDASQNPVPYVDSMEKYKAMWTESIDKPDQFFGNLARELLSWSKPFETVRHGSFEQGDVAWFLEGELNVSYNCVDRHALANPNKVAIIHEGDEPNQARSITYEFGCA
ncbi:hypothetical protein G6F42_027401 [Rhizopus arrhizus]|nr:hypothetical protein G6F42_027401 [Rhizopus arrhizus]